MRKNEELMKSINSVFRKNKLILYGINHCSGQRNLKYWNLIIIIIVIEIIEIIIIN